MNETELRPHSTATDVLNALHAKLFDAATDGALAGKRMEGIGYDDKLEYETWLDLVIRSSDGVTVITGYFLWNARTRRQRSYKTTRGWLHGVNAACFRVREWREKGATA